jgi:hypothetical protein
MPKSLPDTWLRLLTGEQEFRRAEEILFRKNVLVDWCSLDALGRVVRIARDGRRHAAECAGAGHIGCAA